MTKFLGRAVLLALAMMMTAGSVLGVAAAQTDGEECYPVPVGGCTPDEEPPPPPSEEPPPPPSEEPPPPPSEEPPPPPPEEPPPPAVTCDDIVQAIADGDVSMDQNGDGAIDASDLPAECTCEELIDAIAAGIIDVGDLPDDALVNCGCEELIAAVAAGTIDAADLPDGALDVCECEEIQAAIDAGDLPADALPANCDEGSVIPDASEIGEMPEDLADTGMSTGPAAAASAFALMAGIAILGITRKQA